MTQQLEDSWVKEIFNAEELKQYAAFESDLKKHSTPEQKAAFEKKWYNLIDSIKENLSNDPKSDIGIKLGEQCILLINSLYGKKYAHLRTKKFERGFGEGKGLKEHGLTPEIVSWLEIAMDTYWRQRLYAILSQVGTKSSKKLTQLWNEVMDDMYGEDEARKAAIINLVLNDESVSSAAKKWIKNI